MFKKRWTTGVTLLLSSTIVLSACGNNEESEFEGDREAAEDVEVATEGFPIVDEEITLTMMAPGTGMEQWENMPTLQEYAEETNVNFEYTTPPLSDFETRFNLAFASGDLPDVFFGQGPEELTPAAEVDYGEQGLLMPLNDLIEEYAPNLNTLLEERPDVLQSITAPDGNIYSLPTISDNPTSIWPTGPLWFNGSWLDELDEEVPTTLDELYDLLVRFRDEDPNGTGEDDTIPLSDSGLDGVRTWISPAFGIKEWGAEEVNGEVRFAPTTDNARAYYEFMAQLYSEGLLDREVFSQSDEQKKAKGENNQIGLFTDWYSFFTTGETEEEAINNPMLGSLTSEWQEEPMVVASPEITRGTFAITSQNPYPEATMRWVDYLYSEEGWAFFDRGPEGYFWEYTDEGEETQLTEQAAQEGEEYRGRLSPIYGVNSPGYQTELPPIGGERTPFEEFISEETDTRLRPYGEVPYPLVYLETEESDVITGMIGDINTYLENSESQFITGSLDVTDDQVWDNYVSTLEGMGIEEYTQIYQDAYDRWEEAEDAL